MSESVEGYLVDSWISKFVRWLEKTESFTHTLEILEGIDTRTPIAPTVKTNSSRDSATHSSHIKLHLKIDARNAVDQSPSQANIFEKIVTSLA